VLAVNAAVDSLPLVALVPLQPPEAVQLVALVELQMSVEAPPLLTLVGLAVSVTVGADATVTVTVSLALPSRPVQVNPKLVVAANAPVSCVPLVGLLPLQPPEALQLDAFVELHAKAGVPPFSTVVGLAASVTVGGGATVTVTDPLVLPPLPVQVSV